LSLDEACSALTEVGCALGLDGAEGLRPQAYVALGRFDDVLVAAAGLENRTARNGYGRDHFVLLPRTLVAAATGDRDAAVAFARRSLANPHLAPFQASAYANAALVALLDDRPDTAQSHVDTLREFSTEEGFVFSAAVADSLDARIKRRMGANVAGEQAAHESLTAAAGLPACST